MRLPLPYAPRNDYLDESFTIVGFKKQAGGGHDYSNGRPD